MDIGTAKPDAATLARAPHHLLDIRDPTEAYSAAAFCDDARRLMADITARGMVPLLVGGTMLYFRALLHGLDDLPRADAALRKKLEREAAERGWPALHAELAVVDPVTAARLAPNDSHRIGRALEIFRLAGTPMSALLDQDQSELPYRVLQFALVPSDRAVLHQRIAARFDTMLAEGLLDEGKPCVAARTHARPACHARGRLPPGVGLSRWDIDWRLCASRASPPPANSPSASSPAALMARCGGAGLPGGRTGITGAALVERHLRP